MPVSIKLDRRAIVRTSKDRLGQFLQSVHPRSRHSRLALHRPRGLAAGPAIAKVSDHRQLREGSNQLACLGEDLPLAKRAALACMEAAIGNQQPRVGPEGLVKGQRVADYTRRNGLVGLFL